MTTVWNRRRLASAYGQQFSILPFLWTYSTACTQLPPSLRCSVGSDTTADDWQRQIICTRTLVTIGFQRQSHSAGQPFRRQSGSHSSRPDSKPWRQTKCRSLTVGITEETNLLACVPWRITLCNTRTLMNKAEPLVSRIKKGSLCSLFYSLILIGFSHWCIAQSVWCIWHILYCFILVTAGLDHSIFISENSSQATEQLLLLYTLKKVLVLYLTKPQVHWCTTKHILYLHLKCAYSIWMRFSFTLISS